MKGFGRAASSTTSGSTPGSTPTLIAEESQIIATNSGWSTNGFRWFWISQIAPLRSRSFQLTGSSALHCPYWSAAHG